MGREDWWFPKLLFHGYLMRPWDLEVLPEKMKTRSKLCSTFQGPTVHFSGERGMGQNPPTFHVCTWPLGHKRLVTKKLYAFEHMEFSGGLSFVYNIISLTLGVHNTGGQMSGLHHSLPYPADHHLHTHTHTSSSALERSSPGSLSLGFLLLLPFRSLRAVGPGVRVKESSCCFC